MAQLFPVAELGALRPGATLSVPLADDGVALFNVGGTVYALHDGCIRCNAPLSEGTRNGMRVMCSRCGWDYDIQTGSVCAVPDLRIRSFEVSVVGSKLMLSVADLASGD